MQFCQRCESRLPRLQNTTLQLVCPKCGAIMDAENADQPYLSGSQPHSSQDIVVIDKKEMKLQVHPTIRIDCPKCDGQRASYWTTIVGAEEESMEVQVFKCIKCRYTWREKG